MTPNWASASKGPPTVLSNSRYSSCGSKDSCKGPKFGEWTLILLPGPERLVQGQNPDPEDKLHTWGPCPADRPPSPFSNGLQLMPRFQAPSLQCAGSGKQSSRSLWVLVVYAEGGPGAYHLVSAVGKGSSGPKMYTQVSRIDP